MYFHDNILGRGSDVTWHIFLSLPDMIMSKRLLTPGLADLDNILRYAVYSVIYSSYNFKNNFNFCVSCIV